MIRCGITTAAIPGTLPVAGHRTYAKGPPSGDPSASGRSVAGREVRWLFVHARAVPAQPDCRTTRETATGAFLSSDNIPSSAVLIEKGQRPVDFSIHQTP